MVEFVFDGKTVRWIVNWLNENSIPTKGESVIKKGYIKRRNIDGSVKEVKVSSNLWRDNVVRLILSNTYYKGERFDRYGNQYHFPMILTGEKWNLLQYKIKENKSINQSGNKPVHNYLLKNLLFCKRDGVKLLGRIKSDERTYLCSRKRKEVRLKGELPCSLPSPNLDFLETFIWNTLTEVMSNSHLIKEEFKRQKLQNSNWKTSISTCEKKEKSLEEKLGEIEKRKSKLVNLHLDEMMDEDIYKLEYSKLKEKEFETRENLLEIKNNLFILGDTKGWVDWTIDFKKEVESWKGELDFNTKREKVEKHIKRIDIDFDEVTRKYLIEVTFRYPMINDRLEWNDEKKKKLGYKIHNGNEKIKFLTDKTSHQKIATSEIV